MEKVRCQTERGLRRRVVGIGVISRKPAKGESDGEGVDHEQG